jgi:hypothetical protein
MSKRETPMIRQFWQEMGGTLIEEFPAVKRSRTRGQRLLDGVILPKKETRIAHWKEVSLEGEEVIVVQAKARRLGMSLMGQTLFSAELIKSFKPSSVRSVAICTEDDDILRPMLEQFPGMEVIILPKES